MISREIVKRLNYTKQPEVTSVSFEDPAWEEDELYGIVGTNLKKTFDIREVG